MSTTQDTEQSYDTTPQRRARRPAARQNELRKTGRSIVIGIGIGLALLIVLFAVYQIASAGHVYRGVSLGGVDMGGADPNSAQLRAQTALATWQEKPITLEYGDRTWQFKPAELGLSANPQNLAKQAMNVGREGNILGNLGEQIAGALTGYQLAPQLDVDQAQYAKTVSTVSAEIDEAPVDANLTYAAGGTIPSSPEKTGRKLDTVELASILTNGAGFRGDKAITLPVKTLEPDIKETDLEQAKNQAAKVLDSPFQIKHEEQKWELSANELSSMLEFAKVTKNDKPALIASLNHALLDGKLHEIAQSIDIETENAKVEMEGVSVKIVKEVEGDQLDVEKTRQSIIERAGNGDNDADLVMSKQPAKVKAGDLEPLKKQVESWVSHPVVLRDGKEEMTLTPEGTAGFVEYEVVNDSTPVVRLSTDGLASFVNGLAEKVYVPAQDARFRWKNNQVIVLAESKVGHEIDLPSTVAALDSAITSGQNEVQAITRETQPKVLTSEKDNIVIREQLMDATTYYKGSSAARAHNVELAASRLDGVLIPPGGIFSFDKEVGPTTLSAGFQMGYGITTVNGETETVPAEAGGICQVSTTLFHSAFWAGLEIVERSEHAYWMPLYGQPPRGMKGLDATVYTPYVDFKFKNNTGNWLAIKTSAGNGTLTFTLHGTNPGWKVNVSGPEITNVIPTTQEPSRTVDPKMAPGTSIKVSNAHEGFTSKIYRKVTKGTEVISEYTVVSNFAPVKNEYLVGPEPSKPEPAPSPTPTAEPSPSPAEPTETAQPSPTPGQ